MTNKKTILGISLAAAFAVSMIFAQNAVASGTHLEIDEVELETDGEFAKVNISTAADIPVGTGAFGYGVFTDGLNNVLALTTHVCAADSFVQGDIAFENKNCPFKPQGSIGVLEFLRDNVGAPFPKGQIDQANDGPDMHPHILDLKPMEGDCSAALSANGLVAGEASVEVDVGSSLGNNISPSDYLVSVDGNKIKVGNIPINDQNLPGDTVGMYASFDIFPLHDGKSNITNLCLYNVDITP